jgi:hypothetical protein
LVAVALVAAACGSSAVEDGELSSATDAAAVESDPTERTRLEPSPPDVTVSGLDIYRGAEIAGAPEPLVDLEEIRSGGPPPDGIPSIDDPVFLPRGGREMCEIDQPAV